MISKILGARAASAALVALTIAAVAAPTAAEAGRRTRAAVGVGVAAGIVGLAVGAAAARDREVVYEEDVPARRCWTERQEVEDEYGDLHVRRVRVCD